MKKIIILIILLVFISITLRILSIPSLNWDMTEHNVPWYMTLYNNGIAKALGTRFADYTPPYTYLIALATFTHGFIPPLVAIKLISISFDIFCAFVIYKIVRLKFEQGILPVLAAAIYFALPSVFLNSAHWGQVDSLYTFFLLICLYFVLKEKPFMAMYLALGLAFSVKAQGGFFVPFLCVMAIRKKIPWTYFSLMPIIYFIAVLPVVLLGRPLLEVLLIYLAQAATYPELAMNEPIFYTLFSHEWYLSILPFALVLAAVLIIGWVYATSQSKAELNHKYVVLIAFISVALVPFVLPKMHDRYFYPADVLSIVLVFYWPALWFIPILYQLSSTSAISIFLFGTNPIFVVYGFYLNTIALAVVLRTQRLAEKRAGTNRTISSSLSWLATVLTPIVLLGIGMNFLLTPTFMRLEYNLPHVPADTYGFSKSERFQWASQTMDYLTNSKQSQYLNNQRFENGSPVFNEREIATVDGIKKFIQETSRIWSISLAATFILIMLAWAGDWLPNFRQGIKRGGWLTVGLTIIIGVVIAIFASAHPNTYFQNSDTFLRLFPTIIWRDSFLIMAIGMIGCGSLLAISLAKTENKS